jgi:oxygen-dependent protoporphyrinogen oxidase
MNDADVLIVGGGISGLASAWWLAQEGFKVEVWEASERMGGKIRSHRDGGYLTESAANMVMNFRPEVSEFLAESGLQQDKQFRSEAAQTRRYLLDSGQLKSISMNPSSLFLSGLFSLKGCLRLLAEPFAPSAKGGEETVSEFITRRLGREVLEKAIEPFVAGTLAGDPDRASAAATLPRLVALERRYGSITAGILVNRLLRRKTACVNEIFSFKNGMETLVDGLSRTPGVRIRTGHKVNEMEPCENGWRVSASTGSGGCTLNVRHTVLSAPASAAAELLQPLSAELALLLDEIDYAPVSVVHMGFDRGKVAHPLTGAGFLVPRGAGSADKADFPINGNLRIHSGLAINGNLWMSSLFDGRAPAGKVLLTSYLGGSRRPEAAAWDEQRSVDETCAALQPLLGITGDPEMVRVDRHPQALPLYNGAHQARELAIAGHLERLPGLHLEGNYRGGVSVRDRIARGQALAKSIVCLDAQPAPKRHPVVTAPSFRPLGADG